MCCGKSSVLFKQDSERSDLIYKKRSLMPVCRVDPNWVSCDSAQFNSNTNYMELVQTPKLKAQSHKTAPTSSWITANLGAPTPLLRFTNSLGWFTKHESTILLITILLERIHSRMAKWKRCIGQSKEGGRRRWGAKTKYIFLIIPQDVSPEGEIGDFFSRK